MKSACVKFLILFNLVLLVSSFQKQPVRPTPMQKWRPSIRYSLHMPLNPCPDKSSSVKLRAVEKEELNVAVSAVTQPEVTETETVYLSAERIGVLSRNVSFAETEEGPQPYWCYWGTAYELTQAGFTGTLTGLFVAMFKLSIEAVRRVSYEQDVLVHYPWLVATIPAFGGASVGLFLLLGGPFPPGLRGTVQEVDQSTPSLVEQAKISGNFLRKSAASVMTLGTGCSLGPEGPCVEIGMNVARACTQLNKKEPQRALEERGQLCPSDQRKGWNRILLSCGAAAGVAAGFNAPIAGVFFALEIMQSAFYAMDQQYAATSDENPTTNLWASMMTTTTITPILISSVLSALVAQAFLGNQLILVLTQYSLKTPLIELPLFLLLGALSGVTAFVFSYSAKISQQFFDGDIGTDEVKETMKAIPNAAKPIIGGLLCGLVGLIFPQILFFGYETLNSLLKNNSISLTLCLSLLAVKTIMTAVTAGSGLVGGTFAPSLFLGAMLGAAFHETASHAIQGAMHFDLVAMGGHPVDTYAFGVPSALRSYTQIWALPNLQLAGTPAYAMVGAASVLAALFRAPLTASLLLFEVTRNYDVILPLMASAGVGSIVSDILEDTFERSEEMKRRDLDPVSWGDLADDELGNSDSSSGNPNKD